VRATHREDVVQEVWLTVHRRLASFDREASAAHWIAGVTRFVAWRHIRATVRAHRKLEALQAIGRTELEDPIVDRETVAVVRTALAGLEPMFRDAVVSVEIEGWSGPEAAEQLGVPLNTLYSRLRLGRKRLRESLLALEADERPRESVPREAAARTWAAIAPMFAPSIGKASVLGSLGAWWLVPAAAVIGIGVVAIAPAKREAPPSVAVIEREPTTPVGVASETRASPVVAATAAPIVETPPPIAPAPTPARAIAPIPTRAIDRDEGPDEAALVRAALAAIERGDADDALARLREHETRFPTGVLAIERRAARVRALCLAEKRAQARGEAQSLLRDHPQAPAALAVRDACPVTDRPASGEP
jgi:RNA polymerase sigma factor (sigma-70 family)